MENFENNFSSAQTPETVSPEPRFSSKQKTAAWCALVAGFFAARLLLWNFFPLGSLIFSLAVYIATSLFIFTEGRTVKVKDVVIPTAATVLSFGHIVTSDRVLQNLISLALCIMYVYWVWTSEILYLLPRSIINQSFLFAVAGDVVAPDGKVTSVSG